MSYSLEHVLYNPFFMMAEVNPFFQIIPWWTLPPGHSFNHALIEWESLVGCAFQLFYFLEMPPCCIFNHEIVLSVKIIWCWIILGVAATFPLQEEYHAATRDHWRSINMMFFQWQLNFLFCILQYILMTTLWGTLVYFQSYYLLASIDLIEKYIFFLPQVSMLFFCTATLILASKLASY